MSATDLTAKVLATENIHVIRKNVRTAAFDLQKRILILPTWKDMTPEAESMLVCHEVSHALFTPTQYVDEIKANRGLRSYLNVLEDIRAEKMFQEHYPGSRRDFIAGYKSVNEKDFFGLSKVNVADLNLIDRINVFFKIGLISGVKFKRQEQKFVDKIRKMVTFQDVVDLANEIYEQEKQRKEQENEEAENDQEFQEEMTPSFDEDDDFEDFGGDFDDEEDEESEDEDDPSGDSDEDEEDEESEDEDDPSGDSDEDEENENTEESSTEDDGDTTEDEEHNNPGVESDEDFEDEPKEEVDELDSLTQGEFDKNLENVADPDYNPVYGTLRPLKEDHIVGYQRVLEILREASCKAHDTVVENFKRQSNKQVAHIVQQFELKKAADVYRRQRVTKSGNLDINKVATYKFNPDIFRRNVKLPNGQNHGMLMLLDWSGSMRCNNKAQLSLRQSVQLAIFCRKANIPFRIFAFTTPRYGNTTVQLSEFFSNEMNTKDFNEMVSRVLSPSIEWVMPLGSTPLSPALRVMMDVIPKFKSEYRLDKVSLISFTDGENTSHLTSNKEWTDFQLQEGESTTRRDIFIVDPVTKKNYKFTDGKAWYGNLTRECTSLYKMMKDRYDINIISFVVVQPSELGDAYKYLDKGVYPTYDKKKEFIKEKFLSLDAPGRDIAFVVSPKMLEMEEMSTNSISEKMTAAQISRSLLKTTKKSLKGKVLLNSFIDIIC